jgi:trk system potassium uptake protein TrkH
MNIKAVCNLLSILFLLLGCFLGVSLLVAVLYGEDSKSIYAFLVPMGCAVLFFGGNRLLYWEKGKRYLSAKSGFLFVVLAWILAALVGAVPFFLSGAIPRFVNCFYESMSGFTTTGSSILGDIEALPKSMLFWRSLTHWLGGMGIVVLVVAVFPLLGFGALGLMEAEAPGPSVDKITPRAGGTARILWLIYLGLTILETALLMFGGMDFFDALTHAFATLSSGGFSPKNTSVAHYGSAYIDAIIMVFMLLAGMNFCLHYKILTGKFREVLRDTEVKTYLFIFFAAALLMSLNLWGDKRYTSFAQSFRYAGFQAASILTTTGYTTADYETWTGFSRLIILLLMFIGGCAGSTAGGVKVVRILALCKMAVTELKYCLRPRGVFGIYLNGQYLHKSMVYRIAACVFLYCLVFFFFAFLTATGGFSLMTSISAAIACLGNIGPGFGLAGPSFNYNFFPDYLKWSLSFAMLIGRLEVYTVIVLLTPSFWKR